MADAKANAEKAFDLFLKTYRDKYPAAAECLQKGREKLLTFYDFPAEHWTHIRTTNPIESIFDKNLPESGVCLGTARIRFLISPGKRRLRIGTVAYWPCRGSILCAGCDGSATS
jgi:hypothetical protein